MIKSISLREMNDVSESEKTLLVNSWEQLDEEGNLSGLFNSTVLRLEISKGKGWQGTLVKMMLIYLRVFLYK